MSNDHIKKQAERDVQQNIGHANPNTFQTTEQRNTYDQARAEELRRQEEQRRQNGGY